MEGAINNSFFWKIGGNYSMTIKEIKEKYKDYKRKANEKNMFTTYDYNDGNGKVVIIVNDCKGFGKTVTQVVRVSDGKELFPEI